VVAVRINFQCPSPPSPFGADNIQQAVTMSKPGKLYTSPDLKSKVVRDLDAGMQLYPAGDKQGVWWKVNDELGNEGSVVSTMVQLAK
jgi:hypothetical protein